MQAVAVLLALAFLAAADSNSADITNWITYYYMHPQPDDVPARVREMAALGVFRKESAAPPVIAFLAEVFRENPSRIAGWFETLRNISPDARLAIIRAAWESNTKEGAAALNALGAQKERDLASQIRKQKPIDLAKDQIDSPAFLDMLWGTFSASGKAWPVERVIGVVSWKVPAEGTPNRTNVLLIIGAARWSLSSNAFQHRRVYEICQNTLSNLNPEGRKELNEILQKVNERKERDATRPSAAVDRPSSSPRRLRSLSSLAS